MPTPDQQVGLAGTPVTDQVRWAALLGPGRRLEVDDGIGADVRVLVVIEVLQPLRAWGPGGTDQPLLAAQVPVGDFDLEQVQEEPLVGGLFAVGGGGQLDKPFPEGRQPQVPAGLINQRPSGSPGRSNPRAGTRSTASSVWVAAMRSRPSSCW